MFEGGKLMQRQDWNRYFRQGSRVPGERRSDWYLGCLDIINLQYVNT